MQVSIEAGEDATVLALARRVVGGLRGRGRLGSEGPPGLVVGVQCLPRGMRQPRIWVHPQAGPEAQALANTLTTAIGASLHPGTRPGRAAVVVEALDPASVSGPEDWALDEVADRIVAGLERVLSR